MANLITEDFDTPATFVSPTWHLVFSGNPSVGLNRGGCNLEGYCVACTEGQATKTFSSSTAKVNVHWQASVKVTSASARALWVFHTTPASGYTYIFELGFYSDGAFHLRANNVSILTTSSAGLFPSDGTPFAIQLCLHIVSAFVVDFNVYVDGSNVWSGSFNWYDVGDPSSPGSTEFSGVSLVPYWRSYAKVIIDNLRVEDDDASVTWSVCSDLTAIDSPYYTAAITDAVADEGTDQLTITGTNFRTTPTDYINIQLFGPEAETVAFSVLSKTSTQIVLQLSAAFRHGQYCLNISNNHFCFEVAA